MTTTASVPEPTHHHATRCWWDHLQARWVCPTTPATATAATPAPRTGATDPPPVTAREVLAPV